MKEIRVRFAPSPTGPLHIGGVRTALYNYLFARKNNGKFILRIEDTDQTRFVPGAEEYIIESLKWCGLEIDEGISANGLHAPYRQSERKDIYRKYADYLVENGHAYYAFDTAEELESARAKYESEKKTFSYDCKTRNELKNSLTLGNTESERFIKEGAYTIRFRMPVNQLVEMNDTVRGQISVNTSTLDDKVIFKSDGLPTYHLANVVDDYLMQISHVIRGEEWLPSLPLHILLYEALGWKNEMPEFAHLPLILKPSGKGKLSKRDGDKEGFPVFPLIWGSPDGEISNGFREAGYFPDAFVNMLAFLGWNPGIEQEILSITDLIKYFSLEKVQKGGARFDPEKAKWFNQQYLKEKSLDELAGLFEALLQQKNIKVERQKVIRICDLVKERCVFIQDFWDQSEFFFIAPVSYDEKVAKKFWKEETGGIIANVIAILNRVEQFESAILEDKVKEYILSSELPFGKVMNPVRLCLVGTNKGPHLFDIMEIIGKEETIQRMGRAVSKLDL